MSSCAESNEPRSFFDMPLAESNGQRRVIFSRTVCEEKSCQKHLVLLGFFIMDNKSRTTFSPIPTGYFYLLGLEPAYEIIL